MPRWWILLPGAWPAPHDDRIDLFRRLPQMPRRHVTVTSLLRLLAEEKANIANQQPPEKKKRGPA